MSQIRIDSLAFLYAIIKSASILQAQCSQNGYLYGFRACF